MKPEVFRKDCSNSCSAKTAAEDMQNGELNEMNLMSSRNHQEIVAREKENPSNLRPAGGRFGGASKRAGENPPKVENPKRKRKAGLFHYETLKQAVPRERGKGMLYKKRQSEVRSGGAGRGLAGTPPSRRGEKGKDAEGCTHFEKRANSSALGTEEKTRCYKDVGRKGAIHIRMPEEASSETTKFTSHSAWSWACKKSNMMSARKEHHLGAPS